MKKLKFRNLIKTIYLQDCYEEPINSSYFINEKIREFINTLENSYYFRQDNYIIYKQTLQGKKPYFYVLLSKIDNDCILKIFRV
ncbi:hypothetical protein [Campylobacter ureolyticus]|uniref:Uncharacterized protein n=1 Tax=Campylobacter ureolyticus TaxID=827 RepID=A0A9Q4KFK4_9BACT|nr:hypothetical protein [Campylobacter ureolyticus]MCZ6135294.1 hypothetical protein [Campylobacter ureolyticus]MCZ6159331.1 hypothetical protein [Campylobacter ureolyticus]MCZ6171230.1 hypothetical protein [Campylobacter ureolyticus]